MIRLILLVILLLSLGGTAALVDDVSAAPVSPVRSPTPTAKPAPVDQRLLALGKSIYLKNYCGTCHSLTAAGTRGSFGPSHDHIATVAARRLAAPGYKGEAHTAAEYIRESIVNPTAYADPSVVNVRHVMPPYAHLSQADVDALVYFLLQQK